MTTSWDIDSEEMVTFCEELSQRATAMRWIMGSRKILTIPVPQRAGAPPIDQPLLTQYGLIEMFVIKAHALTYVQVIVPRAEQNDVVYLYLEHIDKNSKKK